MALTRSFRETVVRPAPRWFRNQNLHDIGSILGSAIAESVSRRRRPLRLTN
jgi:hypothetical protein